MLMLPSPNSRSRGAMQPVSPNLSRAVQTKDAVPLQRIPRWREATDQIALLVLGSSLVWMLAALLFMLLR